MSYYYLVYYGYEKTVIDAQVIAPIRLLKQQGIEAVILFFESWTGWFRFKKKASLQGLNYRVFPRMPRNFLYLNTVLLWAALLGDLAKRPSVLIHARGFQGARVALLLKRLFKKVRVICDVRGIESEEYAYVAGRGFFQNIWKRCLEKTARRALQEADQVTFVSKAMRDYYGVPGEHIPCCVQQDNFKFALNRRDELREKLGLSGRLVVLYAGGNQKWQSLAGVAYVFSEIKKIEPTAFFLGLTPEPCELTDALKTEGVDGTSQMVRKVAFNKMPDFLVCGDIGLLLRETHPLNTYACPSKFAEYLAAGLHVLATPAVQDVAEFVVKENTGTLYTGSRQQLQNAIDEAKKQKPRIEKSTRLAANIFNWSTYLPLYKSWILKLSS